MCKITDDKDTLTIAFNPPQKFNLVTIDEATGKEIKFLNMEVQQIEIQDNKQKFLQEFEEIYK